MDIEGSNLNNIYIYNDKNVIKILLTHKKDIVTYEYHSLKWFYKDFIKITTCGRASIKNGIAAKRLLEDNI